MLKKAKDMPIYGKAVDVNSILTHKRTGDLMYYDGPLLTHFVDENNIDYLYDWVDCDSIHNRWLIQQTPKESLLKYLSGQISNEEYMKLTTKLYLLDIDKDVNKTGLYLVEYDELTDDYKYTNASTYNYNNVIEKDEYTNKLKTSLKY